MNCDLPWREYSELRWPVSDSTRSICSGGTVVGRLSIQLMEDSLLHDKATCANLRLSKWDPKHKIFLSHCGKQKEFVRQLCKDLEAETHQPFFDERSSSLTKGEPFVPRIYEAARHCLVAVVVLSEDFLTSEWPMIELLEFVKAKKSRNKALKLFPLFYKLTPADLKSESNINRWKCVWAKTPGHGMAPDGTSRQLNLSLCEEALQELYSSNGLKFQDFHSKVAYREAIVKEISFLVAPDLLNDTSGVVGNERLCKVFADMFVEDKLEDSSLWGTHKLGLYGVGGLGKTTMSRALCNFFYEEFNGRVFHVELGSKPPEDLQKLVLTKLLRLNKDLVEKVHNVHEGRKLLKDHMNRQPIFLVLDNVASDVESKTEALAYLEAGFHPNSKIMITARSRYIVEELFPNGQNSTYCKAMASLTEQEAGFLLLRIAAPHRKLETLTIEEQEILKKCLGQCHFSSEGRESHYHPMALQALADYYHTHDNFNVLKWKEHLQDLHKLKLSKASSDIFAVLGLQFSTFSLKKKLLFLDVALYSRGSLHKLWMNFNECLRWLVDIHEDTPSAMEFQLQSLKRLGIINLIPVEVIYNDPLLEVTIHDLYKEFAKWYVTDGEGSSCTELGCVYHTIPTNSLPYILKKTSPSTSQLQRIWLENLKCVTFPSQKVQEWCNVVVLHIHGCSNLKVLHLHGLSCLRHLELGWLENLEAFYFTETVLSETSGTPESLQYVVLDELLSLRQLPNFGLCTSLKSFEMVECLGDLMKPPSFKDCSQLEILHLEWNWQWQTEAYELNTLTSLTSLYILGSTLDEGYNFNVKEKCKPEGEFEPECDVKLEGLHACVLLQNLSLFHLPITSLPGLEKLTKLRVLSIEDCGFLGDIPDVSALAQLESLCISRAKIKEIPGVKKLLQLQRLDCWGCEELATLPDLDHLPKLTFVSTQYCSSLQDNPRVPLHCEYIQDSRVVMPDTFFEPDTNFETFFEPDTVIKLDTFFELDDAS